MVFIRLLACESILWVRDSNARRVCLPLGLLLGILENRLEAGISFNFKAFSFDGDPWVKIVFLQDKEVVRGSSTEDQRYFDA
jgi:hypothetical protein